MAGVTGKVLDDRELRNAFERVNPSGLQMAGPDFSGADLWGVDLSTSRGLTQGQIEESRGNRETKLPAGLKLPEHWLRQSEGE